MSWFQLDPQSIADRARGAGSPIPSLGASLVHGIVGFTLVSLAGFAPWVFLAFWFRQYVGEVGLYVGCALAFIASSSPLLHGLIIGPGSVSRFYKIFSFSFAAYSVAWTLGWTALGGHPGSVAGLLAGTAVMGFMLVAAFDAQGQLLKVVASLFLLNAVGYFIGGEIKEALVGEHPYGARLLWGVTYGLGFGAGLGLAFYFCQHRARALLAVETQPGLRST